MGPSVAQTGQDAELLDAWRSGDQAAGERLFDRHADAVARFFENKVCRGAEDLTQATFLRMIEGRDRVRPEGSFAAFIFGIARNVLREHLRELARGRDVDPAVDSMAELAPGPTTLMGMRQEHQLMLQGLRGLSIDDQILLKSDGFPTYHLANVVDDHHMGITHVIRGEEWISSTPKHLVLYQMFGWEPPRFYHLGLLRNVDKSKLSKRKNPVSIDYYRALGYMPETLLNFLGTLGFSLGNDQERFSVDEMIAGFDWSRVSPGGPVFDHKKLEAFSADDIRAMPLDALYDRIMREVLPRERVEALLAQAQPRITVLDEFIPYVSFFFGGSVDLGPVLAQFRIKKRTRAEVVGILRLYLDEIEKDERARAFDVAGLEAFSRDFCQRHAWKPREVFALLRIATTGRTAAPGLFETMELCGKDRVRRRVREAVEILEQGENW